MDSDGRADPDVWKVAPPDHPVDCGPADAEEVRNVSYAEERLDIGGPA